MLSLKLPSPLSRLLLFSFFFTSGALPKLKSRIIIKISFSIQTEGIYGGCTDDAVEHLQHSTPVLTLSTSPLVFNVDTYQTVFMCLLNYPSSSTLLRLIKLFERLGFWSHC